MLMTWTDQQKYSNCTQGYQFGCYTYSILGQTGTGNGFLNDYTPTARFRGTVHDDLAAGRPRRSRRA